MADTIKVPDIGDYEDVPVIEVLVAEGDTVEADQPLIVLESDKATMEVPAPQAGTVGALRVKLDDRVKQGDTICEFTPADADDASPQADEAAAADEAAQEPPAEPAAEAPREEAPAATEPEAEAASAADTMTVTVPDIGDYTDVPVIEVLVAEGDTVEADQPLIVLESDKATMEVPAPQAGTVGAMHVRQDDKVQQGDKVCDLRLSSAPSKPSARDAAKAEPQAAPEKGTSPEVSDASRGAPSPEARTAAAEGSGDAQGERMQPSADTGLTPHAGPAVRRFARELGVDLGRIQGSGRKGRILHEDVQQHVKQAMQAAPAASGAAATAAGLPAQPEIDFSAFGEFEEQPLARIRKLSAQNLHRNWLLIPHVTQTDDADITDLEDFRKRSGDTSGVKLTLLPFLIKAAGAALRALPEFNSSLSADGGSLILKRYCHIGFAADTKHGLLVPVVRDVWQKSVTEIAEECADLAARARDGKLKADEMKGGCFSISSLGGIGGSHFSPIINAPEVAILGVSRARMQPVWDGSDFRPRLMCPLSLSYDHRVIDGAAAARFIVLYKGLLEDLRRLLL